MGGGGWGLKSAEKVSRIIWMAPYLYRYLGRWWNQYHKTDYCHSHEDSQFGKKQLTDEKENISLIKFSPVKLSLVV